MNPIHTTPRWGLALGCDPEVFLSKGTDRRSIYGSEVVIPYEGLRTDHGKITRDGVQVELNPNSSSCRQSLSLNIKNLIMTLDNQVKKVEGLKIDMAAVVRLTKGELLRMTPDGRRLGCMPSFNAYMRKPIMKDGERYRIRSAAGHIHLGSGSFKEGVDPERTVKLLDVLVGNTCVLLDRDPGAAIRRKVYGRAGEFRVPSHGLEYRTLSNFWLRSYPLYGLVMGMVQSTFQLAQAEASRKFFESRGSELQHRLGPEFKSYYDAEEQIMKAVDLKKVEQAINTNDFDLAMANYQAVRPFFKALYTYTGVNTRNVDDFDYFVKMGLDYWFTEDPVRHWVTGKAGYGPGGEHFLENIVRPQREAAKFKGLFA